MLEASQFPAGVDPALVTSAMTDSLIAHYVPMVIGLWALGGLIITPARDPACAEPAARLQALYADALAPAAALLADYAAGLPGGAPLDPCFTCTFG